MRTLLKPFSLALVSLLALVGPACAEEDEELSAIALSSVKFGDVVAQTVVDEVVAKGVTELVTTKINEAIAKGEKWIDEGGIRQTIQSEVAKQLEGKVSDADKQRILNLADTLCNVSADGGTSFVTALGNDGKDLAASLATQEIKKQISDALPKSVADNVNAVVDALSASGDITDPTVKADLVKTVQAAVTEYVPYANSAATINNLVQQVADGKSLDVMTTAKDLGKSIGVDALKDVVSKNLDEATAKKVNSLIDGYAKDGVSGLTDAAIAEINAAIDKNAPGTDSAKALKDVVSGLKDGSVTTDQLKNATTTLGVDALKDAVTKNLDESTAKSVNALIDGYAKNGASGLSDAAIAEVNALIDKNAPGETSAEALKNVISGLKTGTVTTDQLKDATTSLGVDALKQAITKNLDESAAKKINALIDGYTQNGVSGLTDAALAEINAAIDKNAPGEASAKALKDVVSGLKDGKVTTDQLKDATTSLGVDGAKKLIDQSNLSEEQKKAAKEAIDSIAKDGWSGLTSSAQAYIQQYVTDKLGKEAGEAAANIFNAVVTPGVDVWDALEKNAATIGNALLEKGLEKAEEWATKQLDKLIASNPFIAKLFANLKIDGKGIVAGIKNIWSVLSSAQSLSDAFTKLSVEAVKFLKDIAAKLIDWGIEELLKLVNSVIGKVVDWLTSLIGDIAQSVHCTAIRDALLKLQASLQSAKTNGTLTVTAQGVGSNVVNWIEGKVKSKKTAQGSIK